MRKLGKEEPIAGAEREGAGAELVIDDRERASDLAGALAQRCGFAPRVERLAVGDVLVRGRILIERKAAADFAASILDGRLKAQAAQLRAQPYQAVVILEGEFSAPGAAGIGNGAAGGPGGGPGLSGAALRGAMLSLIFDWAIPILRSRSVDETAQWIAAILKREWKFDAPPDWRRVSPTGRRLPKSMAPARPTKRRAAPEAEAKKRTLGMLAQIEGLGEARAKALLARFGGFAAVCGATRQELAETEGVGRRLAEKIFAALHDGGK